MDNNLNVFVTVAEQKNFTRAADLLNMTPSAVSLNIKSTEEKMGVKLLERTNKFVRLTKAGEIFYKHAKEILSKYAHVKHLIDDYNHSPEGPLSIGAAYTFGEYFLPHIIHELNRIYPEIKPSITIKNSKRISKQVHRQELDIGITVEGEFPDLDVDVTLFSEDEMVIVTPPGHPLTKKKRLDVDLLESETWIIREHGSGTREVTERLFSQIGISPKNIMSFGSSQTIKESVELGLGISYLSEFIIRKDISLGTLASIRLKNYQNKGKFYYLTHKSKDHSRAMNLFLELLKSYSLPNNKSLYMEKSIIL
jgi:DNA-binding transcriptional LysR family regulator